MTIVTCLLSLLALPLFFGLGWLAARIDIRHLVRESRALPRSYLAGLNFLLNEQPDRAIDSFIEATSKDPQTVELQFALGNLFRRRGETDRAIQIHQALAAREDVRAEQRLNARLELGLDFLKAGLLDRAEETFVGLRGSAVDIEALHHLLDIYQQEKEWHKAIDIARALPENESHRAQKDIAQFLCELATQALAQSRMGDARSLLGEALATHRKCVRALMLLGDAAAAEQKWEEAIEHWQRIEQQNPVYLALVAARLADAYRKLGRELGATAAGAGDGFRTLNLRFAHWKPAASGIFAVQVHGLWDTPLPGVANLGVRPSLDPDDVNGGRVLLETHCLEWPAGLAQRLPGGEAYGKIVRVELLHKLHDELKYDSLDALTQGIENDVADARAFFAAMHGRTHRQTTRDRI